MMKSILLTILIFTAFSTFAQNHAIGVVAGASWMNVNANGTNLGDSKGRQGLTYGLTYENRLNNHLLLGADLMYYQRGFQSPMPLTLRSSLEPLIRGNYRYDYNCLALPLKFGYVSGNKISAFFNIGLIPSYMVDAKLYLPSGNSFVYALNSGSPHSYAKNLTKFDLAGLVEIGTNIKLTGRLFLNATASYHHSITALSSSDYYEGVEMRNYGVVLTGGIKYSLKTK